jgi:formate dehydrogenase subunit gamma
VHSVVGVLYVAAMLVHIYMGTLGMEGAFEAMETGDVDINWAKSHHSLWYEEEMAASGKDRPQVQIGSTAIKTR